MSKDVKLGLRRNDGETWRAAVARIAGKYGVARECLKLFDEGIEDGADEAEAALCACLEWDVAELME